MSKLDKLKKEWAGEYPDRDVADQIIKILEHKIHWYERAIGTLAWADAKLCH